MKDFLMNSSLITALICWFVAQLLKVISVLIVHRKIDLKRFIGSGGMPSSHSAFVVGLAVSVGFANNFSSDVFSIAAVLAIIVMYDAAGVRRAAGEHAKVINQMVEEWNKETDDDVDVRLKELLGHTPLQVAAGALLGVAIAIFRHAFI